MLFIWDFLEILVFGVLIVIVRIINKRIEIRGVNIFWKGFW